MRVLARVLVALIVALATNSTVPAQVVTQQKGVAYVDLVRLMHENPLYAQLVHYDRAIDALQAAQAQWQPPTRAREIAGDQARLAAVFENASTKLLAIARKEPYYERREDRVLRQLSALPNPQGSRGGATQFAANARRTYSAIRANADGDLARYRDELFQEEHDALAQLEIGLRGRIEQAYAERRQQLYEAESALAFQLVRRDAKQLLTLRVRIQDLGSDPSSQHEASEQLAELERREAHEVQAAVTHDRVTLAAYGAQLARDAQTDAAATAAQIHERTQANLVARDAAFRLATSQHELSLPSASAGSPLELHNDVLALQASSQATLRNQIAKTRNAFDVASAGLRARIATLAHVNDASERATQAQLTALRRQRYALRNDIVAWIMRDAREVAFAHRLDAVSTSTGQRDAIDVTTEVLLRMRQDEAF